MEDRLLELLEDNNRMLKKILAHIERVEDSKYIEQEYTREFLFNVGADILVEMMEPEKRKEFYNTLINKGI
jgi:predicted nuclease of restriction endonuclease-like RecB superfamily